MTRIVVLVATLAASLSGCASTVGRIPTTEREALASATPRDWRPGRFASDGFFYSTTWDTPDGQKTCAEMRAVRNWGEDDLALVDLDTTEEGVSWAVCVGDERGDALWATSMSTEDPNVAQPCAAPGYLHIDTDGVDADPDDAPHLYYCVAPGATPEDPGIWARLDDKNMASLDASDLVITAWTPANDQTGQTASEVIRGLEGAVETRQVALFAQDSSTHRAAAAAPNFALPVGIPGGPEVELYSGSREAYEAEAVQFGQLPFSTNVYIDRAECTMGDTSTWDDADEVHLELVMDTGAPPDGTPTLTQIGSDLVLTGDTHPAGTRFTWAFGHLTTEVTPDFALSILQNDVSDANADGDFILDISCWLYFGTVE